MQERGLGGVVVPGTYWELSSNMLLVTEWYQSSLTVEGVEANSGAPVGSWPLTRGLPAGLMARS